MINFDQDIKIEVKHVNFILILTFWLLILLKRFTRSLTPGQMHTYIQEEHANMKIAWPMANGMLIAKKQEEHALYTGLPPVLSSLLNRKRKGMCVFISKDYFSFFLMHYPFGNLRPKAVIFLSRTFETKGC